jgi:hypothetical protein
LPEIGDEVNRISAKTLTTLLAASAVTPNDLAKTGIVGITIPKPIATKKAITLNTATSLGSPFSHLLFLIQRLGYRLKFTIY